MKERKELKEGQERGSTGKEGTRRVFVKRKDVNGRN